MERTTIERAKELFGKNFIGEEELVPMLNFFSKDSLKEIPAIEHSSEILSDYASKGYILILGISSLGGNKLNIRRFRELFGVNPEQRVPCFYNQDWYLNETFIDENLEDRWYLIKKDIIECTRTVSPEELITKSLNFPSAILGVYTFFSFYFARKELLWFHDFIWCSDVDHNGDRIYIGKYNDIDGINKDGFSIHRHLALRDCYGAVNFF